MLQSEYEACLDHIVKPVSGAERETETETETEGERD